jgi:hypothetical protein
MNINIIRILNVIYAVVIAYFGRWDLLWYVGAMHLSLELLNSRPAYFLQPARLYNLIFWSYELVLTERLRGPGQKFSDTIEWLWNCGEHLAFALVICLKVYVYLAVFTGSGKGNILKRALLVALVFNCIGVINEVFQNAITHRSLWFFIADSRKDMVMNALGSMVFLLSVYLVTRFRQKRLRGLPENRASLFSR